MKTNVVLLSLISWQLNPHPWVLIIYFSFQKYGIVNSCGVRFNLFIRNLNHYGTFKRIKIQKRIFFLSFFYSNVWPSSIIYQMSCVFQMILNPRLNIKCILYQFVRRFQEHIDLKWSVTVFDRRTRFYFYFIDPFSIFCTTFSYL